MMKKVNSPVFGLFVFFVCLVSFSNVSGQEIVITSTPDTIAYVDEPYTYHLTAVTSAPKLPVTFSLIKSLPGMYYVSSTQTINWTPGSITAGGKVIVKATNNVMETDTQEFYINVSDSIPCPPSVVAYWKLDEANGPVYSDFSGDNDARVTGNAPVCVTGQIDSAQEFNPLSNTRLYVPKDTLFDWGTEEDFSIECWISLNDENLDSVGVIIGRNEGTTDYTTGVHWWIGVDDHEQVNFAIRNNVDESVCTGSSLPLGWHHIVAVREASDNIMHLYVDNVHKASAEYQGWGPGFVSDSILCIGWLKPGPGDHGKKFPFNGKIDEIIIHNKALTSQEVSASYAKGLLGKPAGRLGNFAPLFRTTPATEVIEDALYSYQYLASDIDGDPLTYAVIKPAWLNHNAVNRTLSGTPSNDNVGIFPVSIKADDGSGDTVFQNFSITVHNVNDPPVLSNIGSSTLTFTEGDLPLVLTSAILVVDVDDSLIESASISITNNYMNGEDLLAFSNTAKITGSWNSSTGVLTLSGSDTKANYQAALQSVKYNNTSEDPSSLTRTFTFSVNDGEFNSNTVTKNVSVIPVNDLPVITGHMSVSTPEDDTILVRLSHIIYTDVDNTPDEITLTVMDGDHYAHTGNIVTPELNYHDTIHVNFQISDLTGNINDVLPVNVISVNDAPVYTFTVPPAASEGVFYFHTITAEDADAGDVLTFTALQLPSWLQLNGNLLTGKPLFQHVGENPVTIRITDGKVNVDTTFVIDVLMTNHKPFISSTPVTKVDEDKDYVYNIQYQDPDVNDILVLYADVIPDWLTLDVNQNRLYGKPTNAQVGFSADSTYLVKLRVSDTKQDSTQTFEIVVKNINDAPVISGQITIPVTYPDSSITITLDDLIIEDVDNPASDMVLTIFSGAGYSITDKLITINSGVSGQIEIRVVADDGLTESAEYGYKVNVSRISGIRESDAGDDLAVKVFPNPANEFVRFEFSGYHQCYIEIYSCEGKPILMEKLNDNENVIEINTGNMTSGIYYYKVFNGSEQYTGKLIINK
jgi:hypothetical protein